jgi:hypothetical protein
MTAFYGNPSPLSLADVGSVMLYQTWTCRASLCAGACVLAGNRQKKV